MEQLLSLCKLFSLGVEFGNLLEVGSGDLAGLVGEQVKCNFPLARGDGGLNRLPGRTGVDLMRHCGLGLLQGHQVVAPLLFELANIPRERLFCQVDCLFECIASRVLL